MSNIATTTTTLEIKRQLEDGPLPFSVTQNGETFARCAALEDAEALVKARGPKPKHPLVLARDALVKDIANPYGKDLAKLTEALIKVEQAIGETLPSSQRW